MKGSSRTELRSKIYTVPAIQCVIKCYILKLAHELFKVMQIKGKVASMLN
jgi:hypothetical protein